MKTRFFAPLLAALFALAGTGCQAAEAGNANKPFVIYDTMDYVGKPKDLSAERFSKAMLIYERQITMPSPDSKRKASVFNPVRVKQYAHQSIKEGTNVIALDIESWFGKIDGQILSGETIAKDFDQMFKEFKRINPNAKIGNYGVPIANLNLIRFLRQDQPEAAIVAKWKEASVRRQAAGAVSDDLYPVFYIGGPGVAQWEKDMAATVAEIKRTYPDKRIIGYIWPQYYSFRDSPYYKQFIGPKEWRAMLETSIKYLDGVIIWSDKRDEHDKIVHWNDPRVQAMMKATREFVAAHDKRVQLDTNNMRK
ncbi:MAG: hypothetical protein Q4G28_02810 [Neisseria sp.]|nr:hypothetical protein [Neisseria sp.]